MTDGFAAERVVDFTEPEWAAREPAPDTDAFADARDRITWQNAAVREAVQAERERCAAITRESIQRQLGPFFDAIARLLRALAEQPFRLTDDVMDAANELGKALVTAGGADVGPPPGRTTP